MADNDFKCKIYSAERKVLPVDADPETDCQVIKRILESKLLRDQNTPSDDQAANSAAEAFHKTWNFYREYLDGRLSYDGKNSVLNGSVHYNKSWYNGFWIDELDWMVFGDGDGYIYHSYTKSLALIAHEITHGLIGSTAEWCREGDPGALAEHFCDVIGTMVKQVNNNHQTASQADWLLGEDLFNPDVHPALRPNTAFRSMKAPGTAYDDHRVDASGTKDIQVAHMSQYYKPVEGEDFTHWNSGILNYAFYLAAIAFPNEQPCEGVGKIWWAALKDDEAKGVKDFLGWAKLVVSKAGPKTAEVESAFRAVGLLV